MATYSLTTALSNNNTAGIELGGTSEKDFQILIRKRFEELTNTNGWILTSGYTDPNVIENKVVLEQAMQNNLLYFKELPSWYGGPNGEWQFGRTRSGSKRPDFILARLPVTGQTIQANQLTPDITPELTPIGLSQTVIRRQNIVKFIASPPGLVIQLVVIETKIASLRCDAAKPFQYCVDNEQPLNPTAELQLDGLNRGQNEEIIYQGNGYNLVKAQTLADLIFRADVQNREYAQLTQDYAHTNTEVSYFTCVCVLQSKQNGERFLPSPFIADIVFGEKKPLELG